MERKIFNRIFTALLAVAVLMVSTPFTSVFAASPTDGASQSTDISYTAEETEWTWSIPATQTFTDESLNKTGNVSISPNNASGVIVLPENTEIFVTMSSLADFNLVSEDLVTSKIPYEVAMTSGGTCISSGDEVLRFIAGTSDNTGITQTLYFSTTAENIESATVTGLHADICTFTLGISNNFIYEIIEGANQMNYGVGAAAFRSSGPYNEFNKVVIDNTDVNPSNYTTSEGSTWITLPQSYLSTLSVGTHTIDIVSDGGTASTQFTLWRDGEVTYEDNDIYYYPSAGSSVADIRAGTPHNGDCVVFGDYVYCYFSSEYATSEWNRVVGSTESGFGAGLMAIIMTEIWGGILGFNPNIAANEDEIWNTGWVCLYAGVDPLSIESIDGVEGLGLDHLVGITVDYSKSIYGPIASYIHGIPVISLCGTFATREDETSINNGSYSNLMASPTIPNTVLTLGKTYAGSSIESYPVLPSSVYTTVDPFDDCNNLEGTLTLNMTSLAVPGRLLDKYSTHTTILSGSMSYEERQSIVDEYAIDPNTTYVDGPPTITVVCEEDYIPSEMDEMIAAVSAMAPDEAIALAASQYPAVASMMANVSIEVCPAYENVTLGALAEEMCTAFGFDSNATNNMVMILLQTTLLAVDGDENDWSYIASQSEGQIYCDYSPFYKVVHIVPLNYTCTVTDTRTLTDWVSDELGETITVSAGLTGSRAIDLVDTLVTFGNTLGYDDVTRFTASSLLEAMLTELVDTSLSVADANAALETEMPGVTTYLYFTESGTIRTLVLAPIDSSISFEQ